MDMSTFCDLSTNVDKRGNVDKYQCGVVRDQAIRGVYLLLGVETGHIADVAIMLP